MTSNKETANQLQRLGFQKLSEDGNITIFINNSKVTFSDLKDVVYTNKLFT